MLLGIVALADSLANNQAAENISPEVRGFQSRELGDALQTLCRCFTQVELLNSYLPEEKKGPDLALQVVGEKFSFGKTKGHVNLLPITLIREVIQHIEGEIHQVEPPLTYGIGDYLSSLL